MFKNKTLIILVVGVFLVTFLIGYLYNTIMRGRDKASNAQPQQNNQPVSESTEPANLYDTDVEITASTTNVLAGRVKVFEEGKITIANSTGENTYNLGEEVSLQCTTQDLSEVESIDSALVEGSKTVKTASLSINSGEPVYVEGENSSGELMVEKIYVSASFCADYN